MRPTIPFCSGSCIFIFNKVSIQTISVHLVKHQPSRNNRRNIITSFSFQYIFKVKMFHQEASVETIELTRIEIILRCLRATKLLSVIYIRLIKLKR